MSHNLKFRNVVPTTFVNNGTEIMMNSQSEDVIQILKSTAVGENQINRFAFVKSEQVIISQKNKVMSENAVLDPADMSFNDIVAETEMLAEKRALKKTRERLVILRLKKTAKYFIAQETELKSIMNQKKLRAMTLEKNYFTRNSNKY